jgi:RES domain-containing protein
LVHLAPDEIPDDYAYTAIDLRLEPEVADFRGSLADRDATRGYGNRWATDQRSLALLVPSVVIPIEFNLLLNPLHPSFGGLAWSVPETFKFDSRLLSAR